MSFITCVLVEIHNIIECVFDFAAEVCIKNHLPVSDLFLMNLLSCKFVVR